MIKVFCEIIQQYKRSTLFAVITIIILLLVIVAEGLGLTSNSIDFIATSGVFLSAIGFAFDATMKNL